MSYLGSEYVSVDPVKLESTAFGAKVAAMRQGQYDANSALIDQTLATYSEKLKGIRPEDNAYIADKIKNVKSQIEIYKKTNGDLSRSYNRDSIMSAVTSTLEDPIVQDAIISRNTFLEGNAQIEKLREKDGGKYINQNNVDYSWHKAGMDDYMAGKTKKLGAFSYVPYSDYKKKQSDAILEIEKLKKDQVIQIPDGNGNLITTTKSGLSPTQIELIAKNSLDGNDHKQIEIDAWANTNKFTDSSILERSKEYFATQSEELSIKQNDLERNIKRGGSEKQMKEWSLDLDLTNDKQNSIKGITGSVKLSAIYLQEQSSVANAVNMYSSLYTENRTLAVDQNFWNDKNYKLNEKRLLLEVERFKADEEKKDTTKKEQGDLQTITIPTVTEDNADNYEAQIDNKISGVKGSLTTSLVSYKSALEKIATENTDAGKEAKDIMRTYALNLKSKAKNEDDIDVFRRTVLSKVSNKSKVGIIGKTNYISDIKSNFDIYDDLTTARVESMRVRDSTHITNTIDNSKTYQSYFNNKDTKMMFPDVNGVMKAYPVYKILQNAKLMDDNGNKIAGKDINSPEYKKVLTYLTNSYYADAVISKTNDSGYSLNSMSNIKKIASQLGESFNSVIAGYGSSGLPYAEVGIRINPNSKTGQFLNNAKNNNIKDTFSFFQSDQSLSDDDRDVNKFLTEDPKKSKGYLEGLKTFVDKLPENKVVAVPITSKELHYGLGSYLTSYAKATNQGGSFTFEKEQGINIRDIDKDYVEISQNTFDSKNKATPQNIKVLKRDLVDTFPSIAKKVDFNSEISHYSMATMAGKKLISQPISFFDKAEKNFEYSKDVLFDDIQKQDEKFRKMSFLTNNDSKAYINGAFASYIQSAPPIQNFINKSIDNAGDYAVHIETAEGFKGDKLNLKLVEIATGDVIDTITYEGGEDINIAKLKAVNDNAPQVLFGEFMTNILTKQQRSSVYDVFDPSFERMVNSLPK